MGITFVEKGDRSRVRPHAKVALVLAGGAVPGGAFRIGGLVALNTLLANRSVTEFDIYVGISAGAFMAAPIAAGIGPEEMLRAIDGTSQRLTRLRPIDFYGPNWRETFSKPANLARDALSLMPTAGLALVRQLGSRFRPELINRVRDFVAAPGYDSAEALLRPIAVDIARSSRLRPGLSYLPSGLFENSGIERFVRENLRSNQVPNDFRLLQIERGKALYIGATNLNTSEGVVFGHDEDNTVTISEAVQASTATPGFYRPARIRGQDYVDAGVRHTANVTQAVKVGASLVIVYNPFRPFVNYSTDQLLNNKTSISDMGIGAVINQAFRTMLHTRLVLGMEKLAANPDFHGDVVLLEPSESDLHFFNSNPLDFWQRAPSALHGYISATEAIEHHHDRLDAILRSYGIRTDLDRVRERVEQIRRANYDDRTIMKVLQRDQHPLRDTATGRDPTVPLRVVR
jgi:NTE family protein